LVGIDASAADLLPIDHGLQLALCIFAAFPWRTTAAANLAKLWGVDTVYHLGVSARLRLDNNDSGDA
jgi:hypothetical protein